MPYNQIRIPNVLHRIQHRATRLILPIILGGVAALASAQPENRVTILQESFPETGRQTQILPATAAWFVSPSDENNLTYAPESSIGVVRNNILLNYFTESGYINVAEGESITLQFDFSFTSDITASGAKNGFRYGLYNSSLGSRIAEDGIAFSPTDTTIYGDYRGYLTSLNLNVDSQALRIYERDGTSTKLIHGFNAYTRISFDTLRQGDFKANVVYSAQMILERSGIDAMTVTTTVTGGAISGYESSVVDSASIESEFDCIAFFMPTVADGYNLSNVSVSKLTFDNANNPPFLLHLPADQSVQTKNVFDFSLPLDLFGDDEGDIEDIIVEADGGSLPTWLRFDPATMTFTSTALPGDEGVYDISLIAVDSNSGSVSTNFSLDVTPCIDSPFDPTCQIGWKDTFLGFIYDEFPSIYLSELDDWVETKKFADGVLMNPSESDYWFFASERFAPWVYVAAPGIWEWRDFFSDTPLDDLKKVGNFTKVASNATYGSRRPHGYGLYDESADKTFICWNGEGMSIFARAFDHSTNRWEDTVKIQTLYEYERNDYHDYPNISQAPDGTLLITYTEHARELFVLRAPSPHSLEGDWELSNPSEENNAYPMIVNWEEDMYIFYNVHVHSSPPYRTFGYIKSSDNGLNWSDHQLSWDSGELSPGGYDEPYVNDFHLEPGINGQPDRIQFVWSMHGGPSGHNIGSQNAYFAYFVPATGNWQSVDGTDLGELIDYNEMLAHCLLVEFGPYTDTLFIRGLTTTQTKDNKPVVAYTLDGIVTIATYENGYWNTDIIEPGQTRDIQRTDRGQVRVLLRSADGATIQIYGRQNSNGPWKQKFVHEIPYENNANTVWQAGFIENGQPELQLLIQQINNTEEKENYSGDWPVWAVGKKHINRKARFKKRSKRLKQ